VDRFRLERKLGSGAFGEAHLATDTKTGKKVVLKFILARHAGDPSSPSASAARSAPSSS